MAFERLSRIFRRRRPREPAADEPPADEGPDSEAEGTGEPGTGPALTPDRDDEAGRRAVVEQLEDGFQYVGRVLDGVDRHLRTQAEVLEAVRRTAEELPGVAGTMAEQARSNRELVDALRARAEERDLLHERLVAGLADLNHRSERERDDHRRELDLVMRLQRSHRRLAMFFLAVLMMIILLLMALVVLIAVRPRFVEQLADRDGGGTTPPTGSSFLERPRDDLLDAATRSDDPLIREMAAEGNSR